MAEESLDQPWLLEILDQVRAVWPDGIPDEDLDVVLAALWEGCGNRNFALVVEALTGVSRHVAYATHVIRAEETVKRLRARVDEIHDELGKHGWDPDD
ncbi:hypothetical protein SK803_40270 [Lentzea sp. BCCO 10_0856]|uniref:Uncharacterized protein n=1 Tax=Lentzea miocenica TaxID=3095431 RepID=A0ABU4TE76_9PSEU|nr:hypothetical protein [Lentzea sp. BCCO 10_0856]MDX8036468.1 hypothetical protein [Lentzea sp. BCCO 10_0856]